ncbi:MAG: DinB family protein [Ginsengibacter sp.]
MSKKCLYVAAVIIFATVLPLSKSIGQATISGDSIKAMLVKDWERGKAYTQDYLKAMPADKYSFKATDSIRSFAQQMLHITEGTMFIISTGTGAKMGGAPGLEQRASAQTADSVLYYVNMGYDYAINAIKTIPANKLMEPVSFNMGETVTASRLGWLMKAFEHQTHHRGQTTIYLRLSGVRPPNERLF